VADEGTDRSLVDEEAEERIEQPASEEAEHEARMTPAQAVEKMRIRVPSAATASCGG